jgi:hypothetical protein
MGRYTLSDFSNEVKEISNPNKNRVRVRGRYDTKTKLRLDDEKITIRNLKQSDLTAKPTERDIIHRVTLDEDKRPDLIALKFYGDARLYWIILGANNLREKEEVRKDMLIRLPSKDAIYGSNGVLLR